MKGLKIEKARPSNVIDVYALLQEGVKEGNLPGKPTHMEMKWYYFKGLIDEMSAPGHIWFLAKRGRGYLGFAHAVLVPSRWDHKPKAVYVDLVYVTKQRRKNGIGRKLLDELKKEVENLGISKIQFACPNDQMQYWSKERKADATQVLMEVNL